MTCCICLPPTPEEILLEYEVDVFEETVGQLSYPSNDAVVPMLVRLCWQRFRRRCIGDFDYEYWMVLLNDRVLSAWEWYSRTVDKYMDDSISDLPQITETESELTTGQSSVTAVNETSEERRNEGEDMPNTPASLNKYLTVRGEDSREVMDSGESETSTEGSRTLTRTREDGLRAEAYNRLNNALKEASMAFVRELDSMFMNRW